MATKKQRVTKDNWPGPKVGYGIWNVDDPESPFTEFWDSQDLLHDKDGQVVGIYQLVAVQRVVVKPALVELAPVQKRRRVKR